MVSGAARRLRGGVESILCFAVLCTALLFSTTALAQSKTAAKKPATWTTPSYHSIIVGKSKKADVIKAFGKPDETRKPSLSAFAGESCCEELVYRGKSDNGGELAIALARSGSVVYVIDTFKQAMPRGTAYKKFGSDYHSRTYSIATCAASGGLAPIYNDTRGDLELAEYPTKGIVLWPSDDHYDYFGAVYLAHKPGLTRIPACAAHPKH